MCVHPNLDETRWAFSVERVYAYIKRKTNMFSEFIFRSWQPTLKLKLVDENYMVEIAFKRQFQLYLYFALKKK